MSDFYASIDVVLIGRKTHDMIVGAGCPSYPGIMNYVFSRWKESSEADAVQFVSGDLGEFVATLKQSPGKDMWLVGGSELIGSFLREQLIDEMILNVHPTTKPARRFGEDRKSSRHTAIEPIPQL